MLELSQQIRIFLKTLHPRIYWEIAPENAVYPYLVYDFQLYPDGEGGELVTLSVDGWDKTLVGDTTPLETLMAKVKVLDTEVITTDNLSVVFFNENMLSIADDDKTLRHRSYNYKGILKRT
jgi:hypothetical protein